MKKMQKSAPITVVQFSVVQKSAAGKLDRKRFMYPKESSNGKSSVSFGQVRSPQKHHSPRSSFFELQQQRQWRTATANSFFIPGDLT
jgi:hypothetical protein